MNQGVKKSVQKVKKGKNYKRDSEDEIEEGCKDENDPGFSWDIDRV